MKTERKIDFSLVCWLWSTRRNRRNEWIYDL